MVYMMEKKCGDCTLCCILPPQTELKKLPNKVCKFCENGGCSIYGSHPKGCVNFNCSWLLDESIPEELRPDKCNVIFEKVTDEIELALMHWEDVNAWVNKPIQKHIKKLNEKGISVIISSFTNEPKQLFIAKGHTEEYVRGETMKEFKKLLGK